VRQPNPYQALKGRLTSRRAVGYESTLDVPNTTLDGGHAGEKGDGLPLRRDA